LEERMERRSGSTVSWAVVGVSALALAMVVLSFPSVQDSVHPFLSIIALASTIAFVVGVIGIFHFSRSGWDVEGSTLEWIIAAIVSPGLALLLYLLGRKSRGIIDEDIYRHPGHR
jgi:hypothetical protein